MSPFWFTLLVLGCDPAVVRLGGPPSPAPSLVVEDAIDVGTTNSPGRACADGGDIVSYGVTHVNGDSLELSRPPALGCLGSGDEVLLVAVQTPLEAVTRAGIHALLRVSEVAGNQVSLVTAPSADWDGLPSGGPWRIVLQRVPSYDRLVVAEGGNLTAPAWDGQRGGILALRVAGDVVIEGEVTMSGAGFRGGDERLDVLSNGLQGESIVGLGAESQTPNVGGGGGGLGDQTTYGCVQDGNAGGGGGHATAGRDALVSDLCDGAGRGQGGQAYSRPGHILFGSGGGSGGVDNIRRDNPPGGAGGAGGGIIWLMAQSISGDGAIVAEGTSGAGDDLGVECLSGNDVVRCFDHSGAGGGGAGGTIRLDAPRLELATISVAGGRGGNGLDSAGGNGGDGADGVIEQ